MTCLRIFNILFLLLMIKKSIKPSLLSPRFYTSLLVLVMLSLLLDAHQNTPTSIQQRNAQVLAYNESIHQLDHLYQKSQEPIFRVSHYEIENVLNQWAHKYDNISMHDNGNAVLSLLSISTRIHSKEYYNFFLNKSYNKISASKKENSPELFRNQHKTLINLTNFGRAILLNDPLTDTPWDNAMGSFLSDRTFVDYTFLEKLGLVTTSKDVMGNRVLLMDHRDIMSHYLGNVLDELSYSNGWSKYNLSDIAGSNIIWDIMYSIGLYAQQDRYFRLDLSVEKPKEEDGSILKGYYLSATKSISVVVGNVGKDLDPMLFSPEVFRSTLVHEFTHQIMDVFYENAAKPYPEGNLLRRGDYDDVVKQLRDSVRGKLGGDRRLNYKNIKSTGNKSLDYVIKRIVGVIGGEHYDSDQFDAEIIVLLPEVIAGGYYKDSSVQKLLAPLKDYWQTYIAADIKYYISVHKMYDKFTYKGDRSFSKSSSFLSMLLQRDAENMSYRKINKSLDALYSKWIEIYSGRSDRLAKLTKIFQYLSKDPINQADYSEYIFKFLTNKKESKLLSLYSSAMYNEWIKTKNKRMLNLYHSKYK